MSDSQIQPQLRYGDLREWMREAERLGELRTVLGAPWQEEIGLAADVVIPVDEGPAVVFDEGPGCPKGFRVLINVFAGKRRNMTLGFPEHLTKQELSQAFFEHYLKKQRNIAPRIVDNGPVFENILTGEDIDVTRFPAPVWHVDSDCGGRRGRGSEPVVPVPGGGTGIPIPATAADALEGFLDASIRKREGPFG